MPDYIPRVTIISGEASGDLHGAQLALALRKLLPSVRISGVGGKRMRQAGVELVADSSSWSAIGVVEALGVVPKLLRAMHGLKAYLAKNPPDLLILIDFGFFNLRLAKHVAGSLKVLYYFPPGSWRKNATYPDLAGKVDRVVTPFSWSEASLRDQGFHVHYFGHPLLDVVHPALGRVAFCNEYGLDANRRIVGMLPGSRNQEIAYNLPALAVVGARMLKTHPDLQFVIPMASSVSINAIRDELNSVPWIEAEGVDTDSD